MDETAKNSLVQAGFKLLMEEELKGDQKVWIFEFNSSIPLPEENKQAFYVSKRMSF
jgi:hypothetical protein